MPELDADLAARMSRLAAAVPVAPGQLDQVHRDAVRARQQVRMAWLTPLVVVVVAVVASSALHIGPFGPGPTPSPTATDGSISATTRDGDFSLSLTATKATYHQGEPIEISASMTYDGSEKDVVISHAAAAGGSPVAFGIQEPIFGDGWRLTPPWDGQCAATTLLRGRALTVPFAKQVSPLFDLAGEDIAGFLSDPELHLSPGVWHIYAETAFQPSECLDVYRAPDPVRLHVELEITVIPNPDPSPTTDPTEPPMRPTPAPLPDGSPLDTQRDDQLELRLQASSGIFATDERIGVTASYSHAGSNIVVGHFAPEISYVIDQIDEAGNAIGSSLRNRIYDSACTEEQLASGVPREVGIDDTVLMRLVGSAENWGRNIELQLGSLQLPPGRWRIDAGLTTYVGGCGGNEHNLQATIEIVVVPSDWTRVPLQTSGSSTGGGCTLTIAGGVLAPNATSGIGVTVADGSPFAVWWPFGWSGWRSPVGVVLFDREGHIVARERDRVSWDGIALGNDRFSFCTGLENKGP